MAEDAQPDIPAGLVELLRETLARDDDVVQQLTVAQLALTAGQQQAAADAVSSALAAARLSITALATGLASLPSPATNPLVADEPEPRPPTQAG
jgi:hypothetical protein